jgi:hypothetical protein
MKPIRNEPIARSIIALVARTNRWIEKVLCLQSHNHFMSRLLFQIENIVRSTTRISKNFLAQPIGIVIAADTTPRLLLTPQLPFDDYLTRLEGLRGSM